MIRPCWKYHTLGIYCYLSMNHVEERLSLPHLWIWVRHSILLIMSCCCNVFINWLFVYSTEIQWFSSYISDRVQWVKRNHLSFGWGPVLGGIPQESALGPLLLLIYVNDILLQMQNGSLLQFIDDTCVICYSECK